MLNLCDLSIKKKLILSLDKATQDKFMKAVPAYKLITYLPNAFYSLAKFKVFFEIYKAEEFNRFLM